MPVTSPDDLYGLSLGEFIPERTALAKSLRAEKKRDEAAEVVALRKPTVAAWAVNQLVRTQAGAVRALFKAGDGLASAQAKVSSGGSGAGALRTATARQREALELLLEAAQGLLSSDGHPLTAATLERVRQTLVAASLDGASREQVKDGCLVTELEFAGLGIGALGTVPDAAPSASEPRSKAKVKAEAEAAAQRERKAAMAAARKTETAAERAANRAEKELAAAEDRYAEAEAALREADELRGNARQRSETANAELEDARRALRELDG